MKLTFAPFGVLFFIFAAAFLPASHAQNPAKPLTASELLALVVGNSLPENITQEVKANGLAFHPNDFYRDLLKTSGANAMVVAAFDSAKVIDDQSPEKASGKDLLQHIARAASLMKDKKYDEATKELTAAVTASFQAPECGFAMGEILRKQEEWAR